MGDLNLTVCSPSRRSIHLAEIVAASSSTNTPTARAPPSRATVAMLWATSALTARLAFCHMIMPVKVELQTASIHPRVNVFECGAGQEHLQYLFAGLKAALVKALFCACS